MDASSLISGGIVAAIVSSVFVVIQVILNKKLRTPADEETRQHNEEIARQNAIAERNQLMAQYKADAKEATEEAKAARKEASEAKAQSEATEKKLDDLAREFMEFRAEWVPWGYRAVAVIRDLGTDEDIPRPVPKGLNI